MTASYEIIVIGSGPAGHHAAIQAAKLGKKTVVVERRQTVGGVALNAGTIPSKTLREAILYLTGFRQRGLYGEGYRVKDRITFKDLTYRVDHVVTHELGVFRSHFQRNGVDVLNGEASFVDPHTLRITTPSGDSHIRGDNIIIATGTHPSRPEHIPFDGDKVFDTDQMWQLRNDDLPKTLIVVGGGVIGVEYSCAMAALGVQVTLIERRRRILDFVDDEIVDALCYHMRNMRTVFRLGEAVAHVTIDEATGKIVAILESNKTIIGDALLYAAGRVGNSETLNLSAAGLSADDRGRLSVDKTYRTGVPHIYAAGDIIGFPSLASTSMEQGRLATCSALGQRCTSMPHLFPYGIYTIPEISYVGKTERELTADKIPYEIGVAPYKEIARGQIIGDEIGMLKLLFHRDTTQLLGVHIIGEGATELVHIGQMVLMHGGTLDAFVNGVFNYPTLAECYKVAALAGMNKLAELDALPINAGA